MRFFTDLSKIERIAFKGGIDTLGLLKTSGTSTPSIIFPSRESIAVRNQPTNGQLEQYSIQLGQPKFQETFSIALKDVQFRTGGVYFSKKFKAFNRTLEGTIVNVDIIEEFDAIKNYFGNILNTKKIQVFATIEAINGHLKIIEAKSAEIEKINKQLIDEVKFKVLKRITRNSISPETEKNLFTMEEYFESAAEDGLRPKVFYKSDKEFIEDLISIVDKKHYFHLRYLSNKHAHNLMKLRFVHKPFSVIFLIEGHQNNHIIWETLDTEEATYIWYLDRDISIIPTALKKIDGIMSGMKIYGKNTYISTNNDRFIRLIHDYKDIDGGFVKWKGQLEHILI